MWGGLALSSTAALEKDYREVIIIILYSNSKPVEASRPLDWPNYRVKLLAVDRRDLGMEEGTEPKGIEASRRTPPLAIKLN